MAASIANFHLTVEFAVKKGEREREREREREVEES